MHTHTRGQVQREVLEEAEEWRPDAAIVGCACGWRGRPWTRVLTEDQADVGARLLHNPGPYGDLDARRRRWSWRSGAGTSLRGGR